MLQLDKLRDHQRAPAARLLDVLTKNPSAVDMSDTGTGKTYVAMAVANAMKLPTLVVVPKVAITAWQRAAEHFNDSFSVINYEMLRTGWSPYGKWDNNPPKTRRSEEYFKCQCCQREFTIPGEPCYCHPLGIHCMEIKHDTWKYGKFHFHPAVKNIIFDEVHRCAGQSSLNAEMLIGARREQRKMLGLSATAACSPLDMKALGYALDLHTLDHDVIGRGKCFTKWAFKYGVRRDPAFRGLVWRAGAKDQLRIMAEIRESIIPARGVRVCVEDIPGFPERDITSELYDIEETNQIDQIYRDMAEPLGRLQARSERDLAPDHPLTVILRARQKIELLKVPVAVELARDYMAKGYSVALFVNFTETVKALRERLNCDCFIDGTPDGVRHRQRSIDQFQINESRSIIANNEAGGICVSLQDLDGFHPRVGLVFPSFSARTMQQVFGRLHRDGGKSKCHYRIIFAARTVEEKIHRAVRSKLNNLDALNDADLQPENLILTKLSITHTF